MVCIFPVFSRTFTKLSSSQSLLPTYGLYFSRVDRFKSKIFRLDLATYIHCPNQCRNSIAPYLPNSLRLHSHSFLHNTKNFILVSWSQRPSTNLHPYVTGFQVQDFQCRTVIRQTVKEKDDFRSKAL